MKIFYNLLIIISLPLILATRGYKSSNEQPPLFIENYCNERYDFCLDYPSDILFLAETGDNGDGISLVNKDKKMTVNVYGTFNVFNENIETLYESAIQELAIKPSELEKGDILLENDAYEFTIETDVAWVYQKVVLSADTIITIFIKVPKRDKEALLKLKKAVRLKVTT